MSSSSQLKSLLTCSPADSAFPRFTSVIAQSLGANFQFRPPLERGRQHRDLPFNAVSENQVFLLARKDNKLLLED